ncbi:single-stranded DNA-binding protein [Photobacterium leiognathi]|uniref:single-stranded DNA-binding protein n=1 Tax=Photobacterium leiognathi TaxID=553611 RepID=UPI0029812F02|nr:single-stranded DNA-binding protein [Photobacterium leiognathi]
MNKVQIIGYLGSDPDVSYLPDGTCKAVVSLATTEKWKGKDGKPDQERTDWHRVVFFGGQAELAGKHLKKGSRCFVEGQLRTSKWLDNNGIDRYTTEIVVKGYAGILQFL